MTSQRLLRLLLIDCVSLSRSPLSLVRSPAAHQKLMERSRGKEGEEGRRRGGWKRRWKGEGKEEKAEEEEEEEKEGRKHSALFACSTSCLRQSLRARKVDEVEDSIDHLAKSRMRGAGQGRERKVGEDGGRG